MPEPLEWRMKMIAAVDASLRQDALHPSFVFAGVGGVAVGICPRRFDALEGRLRRNAGHARGGMRSAIRHLNLHARV
jgi:hypothetical protein